MATAAVKRAEEVNADIKRFVDELRTNPPRTEHAAEAKRVRLAALQQRLTEAIDVARSTALEAQVARAETNYGWTKHLPGLPTVPKPVESPDIVATPKAKKAAPKPKKEAAKKAAAPAEGKPDESRQKGKRAVVVADKDKDAKMQQAISAALAQQLEQLGFKPKS